MRSFVSQPCRSKPAPFVGAARSHCSAGTRVRQHAVMCAVTNPRPGGPSAGLVSFFRRTKDAISLPRGSLLGGSGMRKAVTVVLVSGAILLGLCSAASATLGVIRHGTVKPGFHDMYAIWQSKQTTAKACIKAQTKDPSFKVRYQLQTYAATYPYKRVAFGRPSPWVGNGNKYVCQVLKTKKGEPYAGVVQVKANKSTSTGLYCFALDAGYPRSDYGVPAFCKSGLATAASSP